MPPKRKEYIYSNPLAPKNAPKAPRADRIAAEIAELESIRVYPWNYRGTPEGNGAFGRAAQPSALGGAPGEHGVGWQVAEPSDRRISPYLQPLPEGPGAFSRDTSPYFPSSPCPEYLPSVYGAINRPLTSSPYPPVTPYTEYLPSVYGFVNRAPFQPMIYSPDVLREHGADSPATPISQPKNNVTTPLNLQPRDRDYDPIAQVYGHPRDQEELSRNSPEGYALAGLQENPWKQEERLKRFRELLERQGTDKGQRVERERELMEQFRKERALREAAQARGFDEEDDGRFCPSLH
ncbi:hypothetical protein F4779DRAFT_641675 [Xylariaceae sp. FL0662B]|nr:hypothetical protein F4779DRAFT_641675 [Xylariaceae sp. FL0662B]